MLFRYIYTFLVSIGNITFACETIDVNLYTDEIVAEAIADIDSELTKGRTTDISIEEILNRNGDKTTIIRKNTQNNAVNTSIGSSSNAGSISIDLSQ